ncbi:hypothetical protein ACGFIV_01010 [Sphaerisporangium sp. NPDC049003]|uniref:hypothetical protein n=1 Tax=Sphaerisporangium sp. NPDC049003 TaxID=3364517 RepID=UPI00371DB273
MIKPRVWQVLFCDFLTDTDLDLLPVEGLEFDSRIIVPGSFKCTLPIPNSKIAKRARRIFPDEREWPPPGGEGRVVAHVFTDEGLTQEWDAYQIWEAPVIGDEDGNSSIEIMGAGLDSYAHHRQIWSSLAFEQTDQIDIAHALMADMMFEPPGDPAIFLSGDPSGVLRDRTYLASEGATYGARLAELANVDNGFEFRTQVRVSQPSGARIREFVTGYPHLDPGPGGALALQRPGNLLSYKYNKSALDAAIRWQLRGDTVNDDVTADSEPLLSDIMVAQEFVDAGWPLLDRVIDRQGVTDLATLNAYARWYRDTRSGSFRVPEVTGILTPEMTIHPRRLGGALDVTIVDEWFPLDLAGAPTLQALWRMVGLGVKPGARDGLDEMTIIFEEGHD